MFAWNSSYSEKDCTRCDKTYIGLHVRYTLICSDFIETWILWRVFEKYSKFMKMRPVGAELFHADGRKYRHYETNNRFSQFCVAPDNKLHSKFIFCLLDFDTIPCDGWTLDVRRDIPPTSSGFTPVAVCCCNLEDCIVSWRIKGQLDVTCYFISLLMYSACFGYY